MNQLNLFESPADRAFRDYHQDNPQVYEGFKSLVRRAKLRGHDHYGAKALFEVLRFETPVTGEGSFKINNNFVSRYARMFEREYPEFKGFFEMRKLKS
jgi:hypothetical protein